MVLFIMLYKVVLNLESMNESHSATIQIKASKQFFPVVLFELILKLIHCRVYE